MQGIGFPCGKLNVPHFVARWGKLTFNDQFSIGCNALVNILAAMLVAHVYLRGGGYGFTEQKADREEAFLTEDRRWLSCFLRTQNYVWRQGDKQCLAGAAHRPGAQSAWQLRITITR